MPIFTDAQHRLFVLAATSQLNRTLQHAHNDGLTVEAEIKIPEPGSLTAPQVDVLLSRQEPVT
jgi:hypothetical protein